MAVVLAITAVAVVAAPSEEAEAYNVGWGYAGVSVIYSRGETAWIASLSDNAAFGYVLIGLSVAAKWQGAVVSGGIAYINDVARSARDQGMCISFYRPYYLIQVFWPRIVGCIA